jgi:putative iron-dependent peroxidase
MVTQQDDPPPDPQAVLSPLTGAAIFLVAVVDEDPAALQQVRDLCGDVAGLIRAVGFRSPNAFLTCVTGIGDHLWRRLAAGAGRPAGLHRFRELRSGGRHAVSTPGDLLFHIRAENMDQCFELASQLTIRLRGAAVVVDEVHGFHYFDNRDLLGFVDGTENPAGPAAARATLIGPEEPEFVAGSYVIVQKYLHDLDAWNALPTEEQERIIGRTKLADIELADEVKPTSAHNALTTIEDAEGNELKIVRDNMPFGSVSSREFGTYFIGYARSPATIEQMLVNMFIGAPEGNYDRVLDFSTAVTGTLFFVPSQTLLESLADGPPGAAGRPEAPDESRLSVPSTQPDAAGQSGSLAIGSLKGVSGDE